MEMKFDLKAQIDTIVKKVQSDKKIGEKFEKDPASVIKELVGIELPKDQLKALIDGIKAKLNLNAVGDMLGNIGGLFGGKK